MSKLDSKVHWRLNDLLRAGKKAKEFAAVSWSDPAEQANDQFVPWHPVDSQTMNEEEPDLAGAMDLEEEVSPLETLSSIQIENSPAIQAALIQAREDAFKDGFQQGSQQSDNKYQDALKTAQLLAQNLQAKQDNIGELYDPLKKLALHLAQQLVRGDLALSQHSIQRLVSQAIELIEQQGVGKMVVLLHPSDADAMLDVPDAFSEEIELRADANLSRGSVRVTMGDTVIDDLIESRLQDLADQIYQPDILENTNSQEADEAHAAYVDSSEDSPSQPASHSTETTEGESSRDIADSSNSTKETDE